MNKFFINSGKFQPVFSLILVLYAVIAFAQTVPIALESGTKMMAYYSPKIYNGNNQNWAVVQDRSGIMYFANTDGFVLQFDGESWRKIPINNESIVRSLAIADDGTIFVGAQDEFGYLFPDNRGRLTFQSLISRIDSTYHKFGDVWKIIINKNKVYFLTRNYIFHLPVSETMRFQHPLKVIHSEKGLNTFYKSPDDQLYVMQRVAGLYQITKDTLQSIPGGVFYKNDLFAGILPHKEKSILIATRKRGLFVYNGEKSVPFKTEADRWLKSNLLYSTMLLSDSNILLCSKKGGAIIMDKNGKVIQKFDSNTGLSDNTVWASYQDNVGSIWLCLNSGIARIDYASPFSFYDKKQGIAGTIHDIQRFNNCLYVSTGVGLFYMNKRKTGMQTISFSKMEHINTECWGLNSTNNFLLAASNNGVYEISKNREIRIIAKYSAWTAQRSRSDTNRFFIGLDHGMASVYHKKDGSWIDEGVWPGINIEARTIAENIKGEIWIGSTYEGMALVKNAAMYLKSGEKLNVKYFSQKNGLPSNRLNLVDQMGDIIQFNTVNGIFKFDEQENRFSPNDHYQQFNTKKKAEQSHVLSSFCLDGHVWLNLRGRLAVSSSHGTKDSIITKPFYDIPEYDIQTIFVDSGHICWFGGSEGLIRYKGTLKENSSSKYKPLIKNVYLKNDSLLLNTVLTQDHKSPKIDYELNDIQFEFAAPYFSNYSPVLYKYILEGYDTEWSQEKHETVKGYTNLKGGNYTFRVRAINKYGELSKQASFAFTIMTPWYRTWWSYILYAFIFTILMFYIIQRIISNTRQMAIQEHQKIEHSRKRMEEELRGQIAADFHDELGTRITRISLFSEILKKNQKDVIDDSTNYLDKISENADGLYHETRDFIWQLDPNKDRLPDFIARIKNFADDLFEESDIQFEIRNRVNNSEKIRLKIEWRRHLVRIFKEAIHNAFKYSGCNIVIFEISQNENQLIFLLQDDGKGFDLSEKSEGNGLVNMQKRAEKLDAEFIINSEIKSGTKIKLLVKT